MENVALRPSAVSTLPCEPWHPRGSADKQRAAAGTEQTSALLLSWAQRELRKTLSRSTLLDGRPYEIFGQGSRVNNTYLEHGSDIDLVVMLRGPLELRVEAFDEVRKDNSKESHRVDIYGWEEFRDDVLAALRESYSVSMGRRCANIDSPDSLFGEMVDILVATEYRFYSTRPASGIESYEQGVFFRDLEGRPIVNFPKQHRCNGNEKDIRTGGLFKEIVRTTKRLRRLAEREHMIVEGSAPSYLLECLLYNVPDNVYRTSTRRTAYRNALRWLRWRHREDPKAFDEMLCQNSINRLFGAGPDQWGADEAGRIVDVLHQI